MHPLIHTFYKALERMHAEFENAVRDLPQEALDWVPGEGMNSIAVLTVHTAGSSRYWIGELIGGDPSGRDREAEFKKKGLAAGELIALLHATLAHHEKSLQGLTIEALEEIVESPVHGRAFSKGWGLVHMIDHTAEHLGHVQLTRQLWEQQHGRQGA